LEESTNDQEDAAHKIVPLIVIISDAGILAGGEQTKFYLSSAGSDANPGTIEKPWKTLNKIDGYAFAPGDTIFFECRSEFDGGFQIKSSGKASMPIVFTAYSYGPAPIFRNRDYELYNGNAIQIHGSHIIIEGLYFYDCPKSPVCEDVKTLGAIFIAAGANKNVVKNCEFTKTPVGIQVYGQHNLLTGNYIHDNHIPIRPHWGPMGIIVCTSNNEISYNRFENYCAPSNEYGHDGGAIEINDGRFEKVNLYIHHNYSSGNQGFIENIQSDCKSENWLIAYNVCDDYQSWLGLTNVQNIRVENNTVLRIKKHAGYNDFFWFNEDFKPNEVFIRNNIFVVGDGISPIYYQGDGILQHHDHNLYYCIDGKTFENGETYSVLGTPLGRGEKIANPLFVDFANRDLHLRNGSPAIDAGVNLGHKKDFDNNPVPFGGSPDFGAYEYIQNE
jgi:hypothetical protein